MTIIGQGPEEARLKAQAAALGVSDDVAFIGWLPREKVSQMYDSHDLMVFPSLHDSGGTVVLEALSRGLPVMCLDLGGPRQIVTAGSGITVETSGRNAAEVARAMSDEMLRLFAAPGLLRALSAGAVARAREFLVSSQVGRFYRTASALIGVKEESVFSSEEKNQKTFTSPLAPTSPAKPRICTLAQT
jgi:glycosyltransferase involved in cell wall biosynthesis